MDKLINELLKRGLISQEQLADARYKQIGAKKPLQELLVDMGFLSEDDLVAVVSEVFGMTPINFPSEKIDPTALKLLPYNTAKRYGVFPIRKEGNALILAMSNPQDVMAIDDISALTSIRVKAVFAKRADIEKYIEEYYQFGDSVYDLLKNIVDDSDVEVITEGTHDIVMPDTGVLGADDSPVIRLVNLIMSDAVKSRASDIHIEPQEDIVNVRYRIDGYLKNIMTVPGDLRSSLIARIKILSELDIAEKRKAQDGRIRISIGGKKIDMRVSILPTFYGEKAVMRLLNTAEAKVDLKEIGFEDHDLMLFKRNITRAQGMVLITGPTGSGKTSTLYAAINFIKSETKNIVTIEDPIEYLLEGISQTQINPIKDVTFANGLRSILRQDPNIILVGEIRDKETAEVAFRSSLTGHMVFSTIHTNNAVSTITRLVDIGLESYLIASALTMVVAQRLVRRICPDCKETYTPDKKLLQQFGAYIEKLGIKKFYKGAGCDQCGFTGFRGRTAIFEILEIDDKVKGLIAAQASEDEILQAARKNGLKMMAEAGVEKVAAGITALEEIASVADLLEEIEVLEKIPGVKKKSPKPYEEVSSVQEEKPVTREIPKILIADDEDDLRDILALRFESSGYQVVTAPNGKEAVKCAFVEKPDLIIMDVMMPEMDGFEATRALRANLETATIPILMLTAKQDKTSELEGLDAGADDYVTKPFDKDKLLARVKMLLRRQGQS